MSNVLYRCGASSLVSCDMNPSSSFSPRRKAFAFTRFSFPRTIAVEGCLAPCTPCRGWLKGNRGDGRWAWERNSAAVRSTASAFRLRPGLCGAMGLSVRLKGQLELGCGVLAEGAEDHRFRRGALPEEFGAGLDRDA